MSKGKHSEAEIIGALKQLEAGRTAEDVGREMGVSKHTIYAWKAKFGGLDVNEAQRPNELTKLDHNRVSGMRTSPASHQELRLQILRPSPLKRNLRYPFTTCRLGSRRCASCKSSG